MCANVELPAANGSLQAVYLAHKLQHKTSRRFTPYLIRCVSLFNIALTHHHYTISYFGRLFLVVGHEHAGEFQFFMQLTQPATQLFTHLRIQRAKRFIKQQNLRFYSQRARQRHALFLAAGKLCRITIRQMSKLHHLQQFCHFRFDRRRIRAFTPWQHRQAKSDIVKHRHMAKQRVMLEHETDFTVPRVQTAHVGTVKANMPTGLMLQPGDNAQQRSFSGTGRPKQRDHLTRRNIQ